MIFFHRSVNAPQFGASLIESRSGSEMRKQFGHPMNTLGNHGCREMMRTAGYVRDDFGLLRIRDGRLEHADDRGGAIALDTTKINGFSNNGRIPLEGFRPEAIGEDNNGSGLGTVILWPDEPPEHGT